MATKQLANLAVHKLTVQPLVGDTVLTWDSVAGWPTVGEFPIRIDHPSNGTFEYVLCTSVNVGLLQTTVSRAQESTSASGGFIVGSTGANALTKATMDAAFARLDTALSQTLTGPLVIPTALGGSAAATSYGSVPLKAAENLLVGNAASVSFTSIPATFRTLKGRWQARGDTAATAVAVWVRFNNDSATNYDWHYVRGNNNAATAAGAVSVAQIEAGFAVAATSTANYFGVGTFEIPMYAGATGNKLLTGTCWLATSDAIGAVFAETEGGLWKTTATAINRLDFFPGSGNFVAGSYFALWLEP